MSDVSPEPKIVTVSRDALRADLAEMELRLRAFFDEQLKQKADRAVVAEHALALDRLSRGEFNDAQKLAVRNIFVVSQTEETTRGWTMRERWFGVLTALIALLSFVVAVGAATHHWG